MGNTGNPELRNTDAKTVTELIDRIGKVSLRDEQKIYDAETAYHFLKKEDKEKVTNLATLEKADDELRRLYIGRPEGERLDRTKLAIGVYNFAVYCHTDEHVKAVRDCGVDYVCNTPYDKKLLDLFEKYGLKAVVNFFPGWWGGVKENQGTMAKGRPLSVYREYSEKYEDHPAICGLDICDEPSAWDYPHIGKVVEEVKKLIPGSLPYINLQNPGPGAPDLGTRTYEEYIKAYVADVNTDYISYDHYMYDWGVGKAYISYEAVSEACRETNRDMWIVLQVNNTNKFQKITSTGQLRFQAYSALAYGAKGISWGCWTAGWWENNIVDTNGNITPQYDKLKQINAELNSLSPVYMWYNHKETFFVENSSSSVPIRYIAGKYGCVPAPKQEVFTNIKISDRRSAEAGYFEKKNGRGSALLLVSTEDPWDTEHYDIFSEVSFKVNAPDSRVYIWRKEGREPLSCDLNGVYRVKLQYCDGVFITVEKN